MLILINNRLRGTGVGDNGKKDTSSLSSRCGVKIFKGVILCNKINQWGGVLNSKAHGGASQ